MQSKPTKQQRERVGKWVKKWRPKLYLNDWHFNVSYPKDETGPYATIIVNENYFEGDIEIYPSFWSLKIQEQEKDIVHELCHVITHPSKGAAIDLLNGKLVTEQQIKLINEQLTEKIAILAFYGT